MYDFDIEEGIIEVSYGLRGLNKETCTLSLWFNIEHNDLHDLLEEEFWKFEDERNSTLRALATTVFVTHHFGFKAKNPEDLEPIISAIEDYPLRNEKIWRRGASDEPITTEDIRLSYVRS